MAARLPGRCVSDTIALFVIDSGRSFASVAVLPAERFNRYEN